MSDDQTHHVSELLLHLRSPDEQARIRAQDALYAEYSNQLLQMARNHLSKAAARFGAEPRAEADTVIRRFLDNPNSSILNRQSLWRYLMVAVIYRCRAAREKAHCQKRDVARTQDGADLNLDPTRRVGRQRQVKRPYRRAEAANPLAASNPILDEQTIELMSLGATPSDKAMMVEMLEDLTEREQQVAVWRFEERSDEAIAKQLGITSRTVRRIVNDIQCKWLSRVPDVSGETTDGPER